METSLSVKTSASYKLIWANEGFPPNKMQSAKSRLAHGGFFWSFRQLWLGNIELKYLACSTCLPLHPNEPVHDMQYQNFHSREPSEKKLQKENYFSVRFRYLNWARRRQLRFKDGNWNEDGDWKPGFKRRKNVLNWIILRKIVKNDGWRKWESLLKKRRERERWMTFKS